MIFNIIKVICVLMAIFAVVTLWQAKIKRLGKVLGSIVVVLIAFSASDVTVETEIMYTLANLIMLMITVAFRIKDRKSVV